MAEFASKGVAVPHEMQVIWDYEHEKLIKEFAEAKYLIEEYKKMGYQFMGNIKVIMWLIILTITLTTYITWLKI